MTGPNFPPIMHRSPDDIAEHLATMPTPEHARPAEVITRPPAAITRGDTRC